MVTRPLHRFVNDGIQFSFADTGICCLDLRGGQLQYARADCILDKSGQVTFLTAALTGKQRA